MPGDYNPDHWAESEIAAALTWTGVTTGVQLDLALQVVRRLPAVHAAMRAGQIDAHKAKVICEQVRLLTDAQARAVVDKILPEAAGKTTGQLRYRLARLVITIDPAAARKRYREAVKRRQVWCGREEEGTLSLGGRYLPADRAAAAFDHLDTLATALLEAGDTRGVEALRADVMLDLLQGLITDLQPDPDHTETAGTDTRHRPTRQRRRSWPTPVGRPTATHMNDADADPACGGDTGRRRTGHVGWFQHRTGRREPLLGRCRHPAGQPRRRWWRGGVVAGWRCARTAAGPVAGWS